MRCLLLVCVTAFLPLSSVWAQAQAEQGYRVSGTVVSSADNQPVKGALVEILGKEHKSVMSGATGQFEIDNVSAAYVTITARRPGFEQQNLPQRRMKIDENKEGVTVKLNPLGRMSGRILDRDGEPVDGVNIQCLRQQVVDGRKEWRPAKGGSTDETGNFLIDDVTPGTYVCSSAEKQLYFVQPKSEAARFVYPATYYPDSPSRDLAQHIDVTPGTEAKVDMTLRSIRGARISLTTVPAYPNIIASIQQSEGRFSPQNNARMNKSGELIFAAVPPGSWKIKVEGPMAMRGGGQPNNNSFYGELDLEVGTDDIENLKLPLGNLADIPVVVSGAQAQQVSLQLVGKDGLVAGAGPGQDGVWKIRGVVPGTYNVLMPYNFGGICAASILSGSQDLTRDPLVVSAGAEAPPIQVTESKTCNQLQITTSSNEPSAIVVTSMNNRSFRPMVSTFSTSASFNSLPDGDYQVYAFDDSTDVEYANPDAMRDFKGQTVHLEGGKTTAVQLEVNVRRPS